MNGSYLLSLDVIWTLFFLSACLEPFLGLSLLAAKSFDDRQFPGQVRTVGCAVAAGLIPRSQSYVVSHHN